MGQGGDAASGSPVYAFHPIPGYTFCGLSKAGCRPAFAKWGLEGTTQVKRFRFDAPMRPEVDFARFVVDLFNDVTFRKLFCVRGGSRGAHWTPLPEDARVDRVEWTPVPVGVTNMNFFDRLLSSGVCRGDKGSICGCFETTIDGFLVQDLLMEMLLDEASENSDLFSPKEQRELLYSLFAHFAIGGSLCQREDSILPLLEIAKQCYKDVIGVRKGKSGGVEVVSKAFAISAVHCKDGSLELWPEQGNRQNVLWIIVDPEKRNITVWYSAWVSGQMWG